ncbi:MAG: acyl-CoA dehydrogenase family protein [Deltaproteobacteria bacterium]|nr:acyl-CoA dehydrogenase family protein [Deltaproteobacteria bacterium]MBW2395245.1 acyl-CoA dehydrogenase family protein [Deltaproteobacteria bacterium]
MHVRFSEQDEAFRREVAAWMDDALGGEFSVLRRHGAAQADAMSHLEERRAWEKKLASGGWTCVGWPTEHGGRGLSLSQEVIFHEEYARAGAPMRLNHMGETLLGPTLIAFGTSEQKQRFLPPVVAGDEIWCQGFSEPNAGSDVANVQTRAWLEGDEWVIEGQKVWTSWASAADWCFTLCRTDPDSKLHKGLTYLLIPMKQDAVEVRPIEQITGESEFAEVFYNQARTRKDHLIAGPGDGWKVTMGTLAFERGVSTLGQQMLFRSELLEIIEAAKASGKASDPIYRQRIADAWIGLEMQRYNALRTLSAKDATTEPAGLVTKLFWATWHRKLGELAMDVLGDEGQILQAAPYELTPLQQMFLFTRSDTIYGGTNQVQRNQIAERALGLPREPRPTT